jgi:hypothetical protein
MHIYISWRGATWVVQRIHFKICESCLLVIRIPLKMSEVVWSWQVYNYFLFVRKDNLVLDVLINRYCKIASQELCSFLLQLQRYYNGHGFGTRLRVSLETERSACTLHVILACRKWIRYYPTCWWLDSDLQETNGQVLIHFGQQNLQNLIYCTLLGLLS